MYKYHAVLFPSKCANTVCEFVTILVRSTPGLLFVVYCFGCEENGGGEGGLHKFLTRKWGRGTHRGFKVICNWPRLFLVFAYVMKVNTRSVFYFVKKITGNGFNFLWKL